MAEGRVLNILSENITHKITFLIYYPCFTMHINIMYDMLCQLQYKQLMITGVITYTSWFPRTDRLASDTFVNTIKDHKNVMTKENIRK